MLSDVMGEVLLGRGGEGISLCCQVFTPLLLASYASIYLSAMLCVERRTSFSFSIYN